LQAIAHLANDLSAMVLQKARPRYEKVVSAWRRPRLHRGERGVSHSTPW
jgi:hypothetical protein